MNGAADADALRRRSRGCGDGKVGYGQKFQAHDDCKGAGYHKKSGSLIIVSRAMTGTDRDYYRWDK